MPKVFYKKDSRNEVMVWKITEPLDYFIDKLPDGLNQLPSNNDNRNIQYLAARYVLTKLMPELKIAKDLNNKPYAEDDHRYLSISHTHNYAACMISEYACGIDIELDLPRIKSIANKFNLPDELAMIDTQADYQKRLYQIWCAKEAMYKAYGLGGLDFKEDLWVELDVILKDAHKFEGSLEKDGKESVYKLNYEFIDEGLHLVYGEMV